MENHVVLLKISTCLWKINVELRKINIVLWKINIINGKKITDYRNACRAGPGFGRR
jgi:hypothetical protein